jgi:serine/threonine protein kinase HipA of HipAB toxin-antitoxin module
MTKDDRARVTLILINAAATAAVVILSDPKLRRSALETWDSFRSKWPPVYHHPEPSAADVSAVLEAAEKIKRGL